MYSGETGSTYTALPLELYGGTATAGVVLKNTGSVSVGQPSLASSATAGYLYIPVIDDSGGALSGTTPTPETITGYRAICIGSNTGNLYVWGKSGGADGWETL